jgi:hypothetical protein
MRGRDPNHVNLFNREVRRRAERFARLVRSEPKSEALDELEDFILWSERFGRGEIRTELFPTRRRSVT